MSAEQFDVVIIGGGNAGIGVTGPTRRAGLSVAMIEARDLGGTCPNRGCTPKKVLVAAGQALHDINLAAQHQIDVGKAKLDWAALIAREKDMIKNIPENLARAMARRKVEVIKGHGAFAGPDTVLVGDRTLYASYIVIAAGSKPRPVGIPTGGNRQLSPAPFLFSDRLQEVIQSPPSRELCCCPRLISAAADTHSHRSAVTPYLPAPCVMVAPRMEGNDVIVRLRCHLG